MALKNRIIAFILALVVFISSGGVVLAVHYCSKKTNKEVSLYNDHSCCSQKSKSCDSKNKDHLFKNKCCDLKVTYHKIDISSIFSEIQPLILTCNLFSDFNFQSYLFPSAFYFCQLTNKAPPFYTGGKSFLHISQLLLI